MKAASTKPGKKGSGFSILEMMFATLILLVGLVAVSQLVPSSMRLNSANRNDSAATVFAQHELNQMLDQPLSTPSQSFVDVLGNTCDLGDPANPNVVVGNPVAIYNNQAVIDFSASPVTGYSLTYQDPNNPGGGTFDVRWAVITFTSGPTITGKRFILGVRQQGGQGFFQPISLDTMVEK
jgi:Tfp pilus assembly protein PilV